MEIGLELVGARRVDLRFDRFPDAARDALRVTISESTDRLYEAVTLRAPQRTGKLRALIRKRVTESGNRITGLVEITADFGKAGALEYGSHKRIDVKEHAMRSNGLFGKISEPSDIMVSAYQRTLNIAPRDFLRGPLQEISAEAIEGMEQAVEKATTTE